MSLELVLFFVLAAMAVGGAVSLILQRHPIHSALSLIVVMVALAGLYLLLGAEFIAAVQIIVYAGAIMVLFLFVIMLLNLQHQREEPTRPIQQFLGFFTTAAFLIALVYYLVKYAAMRAPSTPFAATARTIGVKLFEAYVFPFEMVSILLLAAIVGALVLSNRTYARRPEEGGS